MRDFDFHPDEPTVRTFGVPPSGVLVNTDSGCLLQSRQPGASRADGADIVLRHHAFAAEWFKINTTVDLAGNLVQTGPAEQPFAVNCDIATTMVRIGQDIARVDLFLDVLVDLEGRYRLVDRDEFDQALVAGLSSIPEVAPFTRASWAGT